MCVGVHTSVSVRMASRHELGHGASGKGDWEPWGSLLAFFFGPASGPTWPGPTWWVLGQEWVKAAPFPEISKEKASTSSLGFAFFIHDPFSRKLILIFQSLFPLATFLEEEHIRPIASTCVSRWLEGRA